MYIGTCVDQWIDRWTDASRHGRVKIDGRMWIDSERGNERGRERERERGGTHTLICIYTCVHI